MTLCITLGTSKLSPFPPGITLTRRMAAAYDIPVVPHGSGPYSFHAILSFPNSDFCEYIANSADGRSVSPSFGNLFTNEILPVNGKVDLKDCGPGFGLELNPEAELVPYSDFFKTVGSIGASGEAEPEKVKANGHK